MSDLRKELNKILDGKRLTPYFQPIISLSNKKILGYEALIRGPIDSALHTPFSLFNAADKYDLSTKLEFLCLKITLKRYVDLDIKEKLFINASPRVLLESGFNKNKTLNLFDCYGINPQSIVIELTEHASVDDYEIIRTYVQYYRSMGFQIAIDDFGAGYSGLRRWAELLPEYVKIDKYFIRDIQKDWTKLNIVRSIQDMANTLNCEIIAEGIENQAELQSIEKIGIAYAQGCYFAQPMATPNSGIDHSLFSATSVHSQDLEYDLFNTIAVKFIIQKIMSIPSSTHISDVMSVFKNSRELNILPVVDNNIAVGIIFREKFLNKLFSSHYGIELYGKNPINTFIESTPLCFDKNMPIELVSKQLTTLMSNDPAFIITDNCEYLGIGTVLDLLAEFTRQQLDNAKHANPLTLLPGSTPINKLVNQLLENKKPFSFGYFDLDNFKPYNDVYGYDAGDEIIKAVAKTLSHHVPPECGRVGHIGGDDFIVVFTCNDWLSRCENILETFKNEVLSYYNEKDINTQGIITENRKGEKCFFPLISLSVGLVNQLSTIRCRSHVDIADLASEAKKIAKNIPGNSYFINQRLST